MAEAFVRRCLPFDGTRSWKSKIHIAQHPRASALRGCHGRRLWAARALRRMHGRKLWPASVCVCTNREDFPQDDERNTHRPAREIHGRSARAAIDRDPPGRVPKRRLRLRGHRPGNAADLAPPRRSRSRGTLPGVLQGAQSGRGGGLYQGPRDHPHCHGAKLAGGRLVPRTQTTERMGTKRTT